METFTSKQLKPTINSRGVAPVVKLLQKAGEWPLLEKQWSDQGFSILETEIKLEQLINFGVFLSITVGTDLVNSSRRVVAIDQPALALPREYLVLGPEDRVVRAYLQFMEDVTVLYGADRVKSSENLKTILQFSIELANITSSQEDRRDISRMNNRFTLLQLRAHWGWFDWDRFFQGVMPAGMSLLEGEEILVMDKQYLTKLNYLLNRYSKETISNYMMWMATVRMTDYLTEDLMNRKLELEKVVLGVHSREPRWRMCLTKTVDEMSLAFSSLYVKRFFDKRSRQQALDMVERIRQEMISVIKEVPWMDEQTKKKAEQKAFAMTEFIGYPEELLDDKQLEAFYKDLKMDDSHFLEAGLDVARWGSDLVWSKLREPVNKTDWREHAKVTTVNAFYNPLLNSIEFPAAILQPPFFHADVPWYIRYGYIGSIIGHEITHGFDDQGRQFDSNGDLHDWWDEESKLNFDKQKKCIIDQYSAFNDTKNTFLMVGMKKTLRLNGVTNQGENIADNGGLKLTYRAYKRHLNTSILEPGLPGLQHYSSDQLLLLGLANMWCIKMRPEKMRDQIKTDPHSPEEFRINGVMQNFPLFSRIFKCSAGDRMNPNKKCSVW